MHYGNAKTTNQLSSAEGMCDSSAALLESCSLFTTFRITVIRQRDGAAWNGQDFGHETIWYFESNIVSLGGGSTPWTAELRE